MVHRNAIIVEFSVTQNSFNKHTVQDVIFTNIKNILKGVHTDYLPIGIFETHDEADEFIRTVWDKFKIN